MKQEPIFIFIFICIYGFMAWLILYQIEIRLRLYAKLKCKLGYHKRTKTELGKTVKTYRCIYCNQPKSTHLTVINGGKKDIDNKFRF